MMRVVSVVLALAGYASAQNGQLTLAKTYTSWDCCKPVCATGNFNTNLIDTRGMAKVCDRNNNDLPFLQGLRSTSGCSANGNSFLCSSYQPVPVSEDLSYGFAIQVGGPGTGDNPNCCKCYELEWLTGAAADKKMVVQVINIAATPDPDETIKNGDLILVMPGGGVGPFDQGCKAQYGQRYANSWGSQYGGFTSAEGCAGLPEELQGGCYWRFNWARGEINEWDIVYKQVQCPSRLTEISTCSA